MATVHCEACGKHYNYEKHGCCPNCGAYNRPPRREVVDADGSVHCVCQERNQEKGAEKGQSSTAETYNYRAESAATDAAENSLSYKLFNKPKTQQSRRTVWIGIIVTVVCAVIANLVEDDFDLFGRFHRSGAEVVPEIVEPVEAVSDEEYHPIGEAFTLEGKKLLVSSCSNDGYTISVEVCGPEEESEMPVLYWHDIEGIEYGQMPQSVVQCDEDEWFCQYELGFDELLHYETDEAGYLLAFYQYLPDATIVRYVTLQ